jgi:predicted nucleic acid-binding Zn ribbon protein
MARARKGSDVTPDAGRCPGCGAAVGADARFCSQCGTRLGAALDPRRRRHARLPPRIERGFGAVAATGEPDASIEYLRGVDDWAPVESALVNVSRGGLGIVCDQELPVGARVRATLHVGGPARRAEGRVVYCAPFELFTGVPCYRCGVAFEQMQPRFLAALAGPTHGIGYLVSLGDVAVEQGEHAAARRWYEEGLILAREVGDHDRIPRILESLAILAALGDDVERALGLAGAATGLREQVGIPATPAQLARIDGALGAVRWGLTDEAYATALAAGRALKMEEAVQLALGEDYE